eukprot:TRINITY_DN2541_c1_g2_i1.p1 TRINITY_DN2541_c1_g2~~TRINITY_DN2541_c1_g2_i1.p1  ORF type:complete len:142 (-),score=19.06 TRINITY_DN2541_c1_g2_i1:26-451(-)
MLAYDVTNQTSFEFIKPIWEEVRSQAPGHACFMVIGCKNDLESKKVVDSKHAQAWALEHDCLFAEVSSLTGEGVEEALQRLSTKILMYDGLAFAAEGSEMFVPSHAWIEEHGITPLSLISAPTSVLDQPTTTTTPQRCTCM